MNSDGPWQENFNRKLDILEKKAQELQEDIVEIANELSPRNDLCLFVNEKGRSVKTTQGFHKGEKVCYYEGELITKTEGLKRHKTYSVGVGSYLYFFEHGGRGWCVDATRENFSFGRLLNHSKKKPNIKASICEIDGDPRILFTALIDIPSNTELLYDYGDRSKEIIKANPWLND